MVYVLGNGNGNGLGNGYGNGNGNGNGFGNGNGSGNGNGFALRPDHAISPMVSAALVAARDEIVVDITKPDAPPKHLDEGDLTNLFGWASWVRAHVFDHAFITPLEFITINGKGAILLYRTATQVKDPDKLEDPKTLTPGDVQMLFRVTAPEPKVFSDQLLEIASFAPLRGERMPEILAQIDGLLTPLASVVGLHPERRRWTMELIDAYYRCVLSIEMRFKNAMACHRPEAYSPEVQPMIPTPGHSSFPSGHAMEAFSLAYLLYTLSLARPYSGDVDCAKMSHQLLHHAIRIADNRTIAGVHFPIDHSAGALLGLRLGTHLVSRMSGEKLTSEDPNKDVPAVFDPTEHKCFDPKFWWDTAVGNATGKLAVAKTKIEPKPYEELTGKFGNDDPLKELWLRARREWWSGTGI